MFHSLVWKNFLMKKLTFTLCVLTLSSPAVMAANTTGDITAGKSKSAQCTACHGIDGNGSENNPLWPKLAGQHASYTVQQLKNFQSGARTDPSMSPMATLLTTEKDMFDLAAYFESQTIQIGSADQEWAEQGEKIFRGGKKEAGIPACMACHGPRGHGDPAAKYPAVNGQQADYTLKQLKDYKSGVRKPEGNAAMMRDIALNMSEDEMNAVANYMQGLY